MGFMIKDGVLERYEAEDGITDVVIPDGVTKIGGFVFGDCKSITSLSIPDSVTSIGYSAFFGCENLVSICLPAGVTDIQDDTFYYCTNLQNISLPEGVTSIGKNVFRYCTNLVSINIPEGVTSIGASAFYGCTSLKSVLLPKIMNEIGRCAFEGCKNLTDFSIPDSVNKIGYRAFGGCTSLESIRIPEGVTSIENGAFSGCKNLTSICIPEGVTSIGDDAFRNCESLESVSLPDSVKEIGKSAFSGCDSLSQFISPLITKDVFGNTLPEKLRKSAYELSKPMKDGALKQYIFVKDIWNGLSDEERFAIFLDKHGKALIQEYAGVITGEQMTDMCTRMTELVKTEPTAKNCNTAAALILILTYHGDGNNALGRQLYDVIKSTKSGTKAAKTIEDSKVLNLESSSDSVNISEMEQMILDRLSAENTSQVQMEHKLKKLYGITFANLSPVKDMDGKELPPYVLGYFLTAHEDYKSNQWGGEIFTVYEKPEIKPEVSRLLEKIDRESLQTALEKLADTYLGIAGGNSKKIYLACPICRYADDGLMEKLTQIAPKWRSGTSGNDAPPLLVFRQAVMYNNSRAAMLFAEKYHELSEYAKIRNTDEQVLRDKHLSDIGLTKEGTKNYDLGNQTVTAKMLPDFTFIVTAADGKISKSLPKKGADAEKYDAANKDFADIKKAAKKLATARKNLLFEYYLNESVQKPADWMDAYLDNYLLRTIGSLVVWNQGQATFTLNETGLIDSDGNAYTIAGDTPIGVAHPMNMPAAEIKAWQKYFSDNKLKQPFLQVWEPVVDLSAVSSDRYNGIGIPFNYFRGAEKHGIEIEDYDFHDEVNILLKDCNLTCDYIKWGSHALPESVEITSFKVLTQSRIANHIVSLLDKWTVAQRIAKDDVSVFDIIGNATLAQMTYYIDVAGSHNAANCMAMLLEMKNKNYSDFDPMEEYSLD